MIGRQCFNGDYLREVKLSEAYEIFAHIRKDIVKEAHQIANKNKKKIASKKSEKASEKSEKSSKDVGD